jgi:DNA-binding Lrp family transcriptional regulator
MAFTKGISGNPNGRPVGAVSDKVKMWNELGEWFVQEGAAKCMRIMNDMEDEEYIKHYTALLEYFKPKQARVTHAGDEKAPVIIQVHSDL